MELNSTIVLYVLASFPCANCVLDHLMESFLKHLWCALVLETTTSSLNSCVPICALCKGHTITCVFELLLTDNKHTTHVQNVFYWYSHISVDLIVTYWPGTLILVFCILICTKIFFLKQKLHGHNLFFSTEEKTKNKHDQQVIRSHIYWSMGSMIGLWLNLRKINWTHDLKSWIKSFGCMFAPKDEGRLSF